MARRYLNPVEAKVAKIVVYAIVLAAGFSISLAPIQSRADADGHIEVGEGANGPWPPVHHCALVKIKHHKKWQWIESCNADCYSTYVQRNFGEPFVGNYYDGSYENWRDGERSLPAVEANLSRKGRYR